MASQCIQKESTVVLFLIFITTVQWSSAANIVILCLPSFSHMTGPANVGKVLQDQGHNVTIAIPPQLRGKLEHKGVNLLVYDGSGYLEAEEKMEKILLESLFQGKPQSLIKDALKRLTDSILTDQRLLEDIQAHRPDLFILDSNPPARMLTIIPYKLDIPFVFVGSLSQPQYQRAPILPSAVPNKGLGFTDQMTFRQRLFNTLMEFVLYFFDPFSYPTAVSDYAPGKPSISLRDLQAKALLWIVTEDGILDYNAPIMPNVKRVSNLLASTPLKPLPQEFQPFMDNAEDGVVVVSFGSILNSMPVEILNKLLISFTQTKYSFVIRYSMSDSTDSRKILFSDWLPQYDLLRHKNTRLFVTHCGANGQQEAVLAGVPMIGFPLFAEQPHNAARIVRKGFGLRLDLNTFAVEDLVSAIVEVITNPEYRARVQKASAIMRAERVPPVEEAAFWINHVLTFGADHLRSWGQDIPLWKYLGLDILAVCFLVWHILLFIFIKLVCFCFYWCYQRKEKIKKQ